MCKIRTNIAKGCGHIYNKWNAGIAPVLTFAIESVSLQISVNRWHVKTFRLTVG